LHFEIDKAARVQDVTRSYVCQRKVSFVKWQCCRQLHH